jgi:hypothetical protein
VLAPPNGFADAVAVNGPDGTVKFPVYTLKPFTIRKLERYPLKASPDLYPIFKTSVELPQFPV